MLKIHTTVRETPVVVVHVCFALTQKNCHARLLTF